MSKMIQVLVCFSCTHGCVPAWSKAKREIFKNPFEGTAETILVAAMPTNGFQGSDKSISLT